MRNLTSGHFRSAIPAGLAKTQIIAIWGTSVGVLGAVTVEDGGSDSPVNTGREQMQKVNEATSLSPENEEQFLSTAS